MGKTFNNPMAKSTAQSDTGVDAGPTEKPSPSSPFSTAGMSATLLIVASMSVILPFAINSVSEDYVSERMQMVLEPALVLCALHGVCSAAAAAGLFGHVLQEKPLVAGYLVACLPACTVMGAEGIRLMSSDRVGELW